METAVNPDLQRLAERVRHALLGAALPAYEDAAVQGLCCEGAWEVATGAIRGLDHSEVLAGPARSQERCVLVPWCRDGPYR